MTPLHSHVRLTLIALWVAIVIGALYLFFFHRTLLEQEVQTAASASVVAGGLLYLVFGCMRGFTMIPATTLIVTAIPFLPPTLLFVLTLLGILVSSASIYWFSEALHLDELFARKHATHVRRLQSALQQYELPVIIGWSFLPIVPTDVICYVCGLLRVNFRKYLLGVALGEGAICALYISLGDYTLRMMGFRV